MRDKLSRSSFELDYFLLSATSSRMLAATRAAMIASSRQSSQNAAARSASPARCKIAASNRNSSEHRETHLQSDKSNHAARTREGREDHDPTQVCSRLDAPQHRGWGRQIVEKMHMTATLAKWYETQGRHEIFAAGKRVPLASNEHSLTLDLNAVNAAAQTDLDPLHIPRTARDERTQQLEMARLYRQHVLGEKPTFQIQPLKHSKKA